MAVFASDGLVARESGPWAKDKLAYLERYMDIFTSGMKNRWGRLIFIDLMAGPGLCVDPRAREEFRGSPLLAVKTRHPFAAIHLVEKDPANRAALAARLAREPRGTSATVIDAGDTNAPAVVSALRDVTRAALAIVFVDLLGQEVAFDTIRRLTDGRSIDLLFSFPEMDLKRNASLAVDQPARWTAFFGTDAWRPIVRSRPPKHAVAELRRLYTQQLNAIGYETAWARLPMRNSKGRSLYRPLFASRHPRGIEFFKKVTPRDSAGTGLLF